VKQHIELIGWEGEAPEEAYIVRGIPVYSVGESYWLGTDELPASQYEDLESRGLVTKLEGPVQVKDKRSHILVSRANVPAAFHLPTAFEASGLRLALYGTGDERSDAVGGVLEELVSDFLTNGTVPGKAVASAFALDPHHPKAHALCALTSPKERSAYVRQRAKVLLKERDFTTFEATVDELTTARMNRRWTRIVLPFATVELPVLETSEPFALVVTSAAGVRYLAIGTREKKSLRWRFVLADPAIVVAEPDDFAAGFQKPVEGPVHEVTLSLAGTDVVACRTVDAFRAQVLVAPVAPSPAPKALPTRTRASKFRTRTKLARRDDTDVPQGPAGSVLAQFARLARGFGGPPRLAADLRYGSFEIFSETAKADTELIAELQLLARGPLEDVVPSGRIDSDDLRAFFAAIVEAEVTFTLALLDQKERIRDSVQITAEVARIWGRHLQKAPRRLSSFVVPQADDLQKIARFCNRQPVELVHRQEQYYTEAARILGLWDGGLTRLGWQLVRASEDGVLEVFRVAFEATECARTWAEWANVPSVRSCAPESAVEFLRERVYGLSEATTKRRARTLVAWHRALYPQGP
jgi:hypothetical protein